MDHPEQALLRDLPELASLLKHADHVDVKTVIGNVDLRTFLANMFLYQPGWITALYGIRAIFVRVLGIRPHKMPEKRAHGPLTPETFPMQVGMPMAFFVVRMVKEEHYWMAEVKDTHLSALLGVVVEPLPDQQQKRFSIITGVFYHNWAGPVYFHTIRPFHHLVVGRMAMAGVHTAPLVPAH